MNPNLRNIFTSEIPQNRNLNGIVASEIGKKIIQGFFKPASILPDENSLSAQFGVSRTVVREAIKGLSAKGLVETRPRRGTIVLPTKFWNYLDSDILLWQEGADPNPEFLQKLVEVRTIIEPPAAELAASRATIEEIENINEQYENMREYYTNIEMYIEADVRFHSSILEACHNELLRPISNVIRTAMVTSLRITNYKANENEQSLSFHLNILNAIKEKDDAKAGTTMRQHLRDTRLRIERYIQKEKRTQRESLTTKKNKIAD